jgi:protein-tyrosine phosphatase
MNAVWCACRTIGLADASIRRTYLLEVEGVKRILAVMMCLLPLASGSAAAAAPAPTRIAFVDTGNTGRSVTAEALANALIREKGLNIQVISRAFDLNPYNLEPEPNAAILLKQQGIDVSAHRAVQLTIQDVRHSDLILTATEKHKQGVIAQFPDAASKTYTLSEYASGTMNDVVDAYGQPMAVYEQVFREISAYMPAVLEKAAKK